MPALCSYAISTYYAQNYASIIQKTLYSTAQIVCLFHWQDNYCAMKQSSLPPTMNLPNNNNNKQINKKTKSPLNSPILMTTFKIRTHWDRLQLEHILGGEGVCEDNNSEVAKMQGYQLKTEGREGGYHVSPLLFHSYAHKGIQET